MTDDTIAPESPTPPEVATGSSVDEAGFERSAAEETLATVFTDHHPGHARELLARFSGARRSVTFYPGGHPVVRDNLVALLVAIETYHKDSMDVPLVFFDGEVLLGEQLLAQESMIFDQLIRAMTESGQTSVTFLQGIDLDELERAMRILALDANAIDRMGGLEAAVASASVPHVQIGTVASARNAGDFDTSLPASSRQAYMRAIDAVREFGHRVAEDRPVSVFHVREAARSIVDNVLCNRNAMLEMSGLKSHDEYMFFHSVNVTILSAALGSLISSNGRFLNTLGVGGLMHDIGKTMVDFDIINKRGPLSAQEWKRMRLHPVHGAEIAAMMRGLDRSSIVVVLEHHMRYDLDGYPERTPRHPQHLTSRIVAVCDAYDAMTSRRSYTEARPQDEAMEVLAKNAGTAFDPVLVRMFIQMMGIYPPRSVVRLSSGEIAVVIMPNTDVVMPRVRVITHAGGVFIEPYDLDLSNEAQADGRRIEQCLDAAALNIDPDDYFLPR